jgi:integration host factor subunit beta
MAMINGDRIEIRGLGSFVIKEYDGHIGRNPRSGLIVDVNPKKLPYFKVCKELKKRVNSKWIQYEKQLML